MRSVFRQECKYIKLFFISFLIMLSLVLCKQDTQEKVSEFGMYHGYTEDMYDGWKRTSEYLTMADGTRLAYDLFLPTKNGVPADGPFPTLFKYTPYNRAWTVFDENGQCTFKEVPGAPWYTGIALRIRKLLIPLFAPGTDGNLQDTPARVPWIGEMLKSGYAVIVIDRPGTGASFGEPPTPNDIESLVHELDEILDWIAEQPWSTGKIGMFGDSIQARIQFIAATTGNPHLKAILPATTWMDNYSSVMFPGGVPDIAFAEFYKGIQSVFPKLATPVDNDVDGAILDQARAGRKVKSGLKEGVIDLTRAPFRDRLTISGEKVWGDDMTLYPQLEKINQMGVPVYLINGWYDIYARDNFMIYANLNVPKRLLIRPTDHSNIEAPGSDVDYAAEAHRWFDYWLKSIETTIMNESPIHYYLLGAEVMQAADMWPLESQELTRYYFGSGSDPGKVSINNGSLDLSPPTDSNAVDPYTVDYSVTTGTDPHWSAPAFPHEYPNMRSHDAKCLTYTTSPLVTVVNIIGHPVIHLWLSTQASDLDVFAYLEEVDRIGNSTYISQGNLRASHRKPGQAPFKNLGLPWYDHFESDLQSIPAGEPFKLVFDLLPTAYQFTQGNRIRITVAFADADNFDTPILDPAPTLRILRNSSHPTYVELPVIQSL